MEAYGGRMGTTLHDVDVVVEEITEAARAGESLGGSTSRVGALCGEVANSFDAKLVAATRARIERLMGRLDRAGSGYDELRGALEAGISSLGVTLTAIHMSRSAELRDRDRRSLKSRVTEALSAGPVRPRELAARLAVDESQVSRAFRELVRDGLVARVEAPVSELDGRAHWYALSSPAPALQRFTNAAS